MSLRSSKSTWKIEKTRKIKVNSIRRERGLNFLFLKITFRRGGCKGSGQMGEDGKMSGIRKHGVKSTKIQQKLKKPYLDARVFPRSDLRKSCISVTLQKGTVVA